MATVTVNVQANTGEATQDINQLDKALEGADVAAEQLNNSLEKQEARIKTLGGAINIVGGSVEVLAGSLAVSGALTEEQAEQFESAAVGAIAFADGSKRVFEGIKEVNEGLKAQGGIAGVAAKAFGKLRAAVLSNPYLAAAAAVAAVTSAVYLFIKSQEDNEKQLNKTNRSLEEQLDLLKGIQRQYFTGEEQLAIITEAAEANNRTIEEEIELRKTAAKEARDKASREILDLEALRGSRRIDAEQLEKQIEAEKIRRDEAQKYYDQIIAAEAVRQQQIKDGQAIIDDYEARIKTLRPDLEKLNEEVLKSLFNFVSETVEELPDLIISEVDLEEVEEAGEEVGETFVTGFDLSFRQGLKETNAKLKTFFKSETADAISSNLEAASQLTSALVEVVDDGTEKGFEASKKYKIAEVVTSATQAAFQAFAAAQQFGPILGPILGAAQVAAITAASTRAIQDIRSGTFDGSGISAGGVSTPNAQFGPGTTTIGGATGTVAPGGFVPSTPTRAYVLSGDLRSGLEAETRLQQIRRFP